MKSKARKREEAMARMESAQKRTPREQLNRLDERLGPGVGAKRERRKLRKCLGK